MWSEPGRNFDAYALALQADVAAQHVDIAPTEGSYDADTRTVCVPGTRNSAAARSALMYQLGFLLIEKPNQETVLQWVAEHLMPEADLAALGTVTCDISVWSEALHVHPQLLGSFLISRTYRPSAARAAA